jgi:hypothetical protein
MKLVDPETENVVQSNFLAQQMFGYSEAELQSNDY